MLFSSFRQGSSCREGCVQPDHQLWPTASRSSRRAASSVGTQWRVRQEMWPAHWPASPRHREAHWVQDLPAGTEQFTTSVNIVFLYSVTHICLIIVKLVYMYACKGGCEIRFSTELRNSTVVVYSNNTTVNCNSAFSRTPSDIVFNCILWTMNTISVWFDLCKNKMVQEQGRTPQPLNWK